MNDALLAALEQRMRQGDTVACAALMDYVTGLAKDLVAERDALRAEVARLQDLLREAADDIASYVRQDYPETDCAKYPDIQRRHQRDMELCRRICAALAGDA
jgi:hypothetical protein